MALEGLNSGPEKSSSKAINKRQMLDFRLSFVTILVLCVKLARTIYESPL
jgi:hypothetical protein